MKSKILFKTFFYIAIVIFLIIELFPVYWLAVGSIKSYDELFNPSVLFPQKVDLIHFSDQPVEGMMTPAFFLQLRNSLIVAVIVGIFTIVISILAAYALARLTFRFSSTFAQIVLFSYLFPGSFLILPIAFMMMQYNLYNTLWSVILIETTLTTPFSIWLLTGYFRSIPKEIEESALIDGCNRLNVIVRIVLPLSVPALIAVFMYVFLQSWNNYLFPLILLGDRSLWTLPIGVASLIGSDIVPWGKMFAMAIVYALPAVIIFFFLNKFIVSGLTKGAVKA
ncbi:MAG: carbohydrate ABC transporter permease [Candidatus Bathyarchaeia archaeon]